MATTILGNEARKKRKLVPLSNNVIQSRIADLSLDILEPIISHMKASPLKISLHRCFELHSTYCTGKAVLMTGN